MSLTCSSCGAQLRSTAKICVKCGELVSPGGPTTSAIQPSKHSSSEGSQVQEATSIDAPVFEQPPVVLTPVAQASTALNEPRNSELFTPGDLSNSSTSKLLPVAGVVVVIAVVAYFLGSSSTSRDAAKPVAAVPIAAPIPASNNEPSISPSAATLPPVCGNINDCLLTALRAAPDEDVETVRRVALRIDEIDKPVQGNRPLSRKLNAEALNAFNREDYSSAVELFKNAYQENPRDVEITANYGFALVRVRRLNDAINILTQALILDPRRTSTWTPIAEAYALMGRPAEALSAMWVGFQWSNDRDKSINYYVTRIEREQGQSREMYDLYTYMLSWARGNKPVFSR
jgi:hypothetical protein